ncbi:MAG TPA: TonB-dependent receptor [Gemmatimonadaceae bacterium]|nr:TonB-dependent receptor [Gemmatimonadaceae bacterium]
MRTGSTQSDHPRSCSRSSWALAIALTVLPALLHAQQTGIVVGIVTDGATGQPLSGTTVSILGTQLGGQTDGRGHFVIRGVQSGPATVRSQRLGYRPESKPIAVTASDSVRVNFALQQSAVTLTEIVTTGTGGAVSKRELGAPIGVIDAGKIGDVKPSTDIGSILEGQVAGVRSTTVGGGVGGAKDLRIRGTSSFTLNQRPVVYIDGVRADTRATDWTANLGNQACCNFNGGTGEDRLSDLNPDDIDHIEVLKGAAAATLYGSEASNGVIQIFTKRGKAESAPQWAISLGTGIDRQRENYQTHLYPLFTGPDGTRALDMNKTLIKNGPFQSYNAEVQGGASKATYFVSGNYSKEVGSIQPNDQTKGNVRLNVNWNASDKLSFDVHSGFARDYINALQSGNNWATLTGNAENGDPRQASVARPYGEAWISVADIEQIKTTSDANRWTGSATANYAMTPSFSNRLTMGADVVGEQKERFFPQEGSYGSASVTNGEKTNASRNYSVYTLDYLGTLNFKLTKNIGSTFSFGGQGFYETEVLTAAIGKQFAGPGISTVSAASQTFGAEQYTHAVQIGGLAQNRFSFGDRLFTTIGVRVDGNSAFGSGFGYQTYPKIDAAYNLDSYSWLPKAVSSLKIRGALGTAGKAPGPFDSFQTFQPVAVYANTPALIPQGPGNLKLGPEKSTEIDAGFDAGFFGDRLGIEASMFKTEVKNAIVPVLLPPSQGFTNTQSQNIGGIVNRGWEASISLLTVERSSFSWRNEIRMDGLTNKVTSLGGNTGVTDAFGNPIKVGYPVGAVFGIRPVSYAAPTPSAPSGTWTGTDTAVFFGPPLPKFNLSYAPTLKWRAFTMYSLLTMERGAWFDNGDRPYRFRQHTGDEFLALLGPNGANTFSSDSAVNYWHTFSSFDQRDNVRLRSVSLAFDVPDAYAKYVRFGKTSVVLSGNNLMWWDHCHCNDPNSNWAGADPFGNNGAFLTDPSPRTFRMTVRTRF